MLKPKYIGISKFSLVSWRISMLCDGVVHTMLLHILLPTKCSVTPGLSHRSVAVLGCIYNTKYKFYTHTHTHTHTHTQYIHGHCIYSPYWSWRYLHNITCINHFNVEYKASHRQLAYFSTGPKRSWGCDSWQFRYKSEVSNTILFSKLYFILGQIWSMSYLQHFRVSLKKRRKKKETHTVKLFNISVRP